jgi:hypothetical protein
VARYALVDMENKRMDPQTSPYVSYNGVAPSSDEAESLGQMGYCLLLVEAQPHECIRRRRELLQRA